MNVILFFTRIPFFSRNSSQPMKSAPQTYGPSIACCPKIYSCLEALYSETSDTHSSVRFGSFFSYFCELLYLAHPDFDIRPGLPHLARSSWIQLLFMCVQPVRKSSYISAHFTIFSYKIKSSAGCGDSTFSKDRLLVKGAFHPEQCLVSECHFACNEQLIFISSEKFTLQNSQYKNVYSIRPGLPNSSMVTNSLQNFCCHCISDVNVETPPERNPLTKLRVSESFYKTAVGCFVGRIIIIHFSSFILGVYSTAKLFSNFCRNLVVFQNTPRTGKTCKPWMNEKFSQQDA